jgi:flagellar hook assembly protein FlgD
MEAYLAGETAYYSAYGEQTFSVSYGTAGAAVSITLRPVESSVYLTGTGTFAWDLSFPNDTDTVTMAITKPDGTAVQTLALKNPATHGTLTPGGSTDRNTGSAAIPAGNYYVTTTLTKAGAPAPKAIRRDALRILQALTTTADGYSYAFEDGDFSAFRYVTSSDDSASAATTPGTLRHALTNAVDGDIIQIILPKSNNEITITVNTFIITKSLTIEGNGVTINGNSKQIMQIADHASTFRTVTIRRVHFKDGRNSSTSAAAINMGYRAYLTLESCIFSGNNTTITTNANNGRGAISTGGYGSSTVNKLTVLGCTFYGNNAKNLVTVSGTGRGGAIYYSASDVTLAGNLFYGNTATGGNVLYKGTSGTATSLGYNLADMAIADTTGTTDTTNSGFAIATGDVGGISTLPISDISFRPTTTSDALGKVDVAAFNAANNIGPTPISYPTVDFYGDPIPATATAAAAGAVQTKIASGYSLTVIPQGTQSATTGTVTPSGASLNGDNLYNNGVTVTLTANETATAYFRNWIVDGIEQTGNPINVIMTENKTVNAVFGRIVMVTKSDTGVYNPLNTAGTLSYALSSGRAEPYDSIRIDRAQVGDRLTLDSLHTAQTNVIIEGNGVEMTYSGPFTARIPILRTLAGTEVIIRRVHFIDGGSDEYGAAILNRGTLTLESCIFSDNHVTPNPAFVTPGPAQGGAIYADTGSNTTILGCTFYNNSATDQGGAIYLYYGFNNLTLAGNLFYGNTAAAGNVVYRMNTAVGTITSQGYNVSDDPIGFVAQSGWIAGTGDKQLAAPTTAPVDTDFRPTTAALTDISIVPDTLTDYPATDFYGTARPTGPIPAGAVWQ